MVGFFLHIKTGTILYERYPVIWKPPKITPGSRVANTQKFGHRGVIYEVAGSLDKVKETEEQKLYEFYNYLAFSRTNNNRE